MKFLPSASSSFALLHVSFSGRALRADGNYKPDTLLGLSFPVDMDDIYHVVNTIMYTGSIKCSFLVLPQFAWSYREPCDYGDRHTLFGMKLIKSRDESETIYPDETAVMKKLHLRLNEHRIQSPTSV